MLPDVHATPVTEERTRTVLILSNDIGRTEADRNLTNDLVDGFRRNGMKVIVAAIDWSGRAGVSGLVTLPGGVEVLFVPPWSFNRAGSFVRNASKWLGSSLVAARQVKRAFGDVQVDMVVASSPLVTCGYLILWARRFFGARLLAYLTDFFPFHQRAAGQIPGGPVLRAGAKIENFLLRRFDAVACMSPAGVAYLEKHYRLAPDQRVGIIRLWGETKAPPSLPGVDLRSRFSLCAQGPIAIFGGQISEGRGVEDILAAATMAKRRGLPVTFLFVGTGRLEPLVRRHIENGGDNVILRPPVGRDSYLHLLSACDIALVATVANTGVPTFPSKTIDYLRAGLPIVAAVEETTDYSDFIHDNGFGVATPAGDPAAFLDAVSTLLADPERRDRMAVAGTIALQRHFEPQAAAAAMARLALSDNDGPKHVDAPDRLP